MRVLHAEDDSGVRDMMEDRASLQHPDIDFDVVADGESAFNHIMSNSYDYIITDCSMPHLDGVELVERLEAEDCETPIIFYTSEMGVEDRLDIRHSSVDTVFRKGEYRCGEVLSYIVEEHQTESTAVK
jgi:DNA-binding response OmpR family regulator